MFGWLLSLCGCGNVDSPPRSLDPEATPVCEISIVGFDPAGEPIIREMSDGSVWIQFEAIPPYFSEEAGVAFDLDTFRSDLQAAAGAPIVQDDRELFYVPDPNRDTISSIKNWLESFKNPEGE